MSLDKYTFIQNFKDLKGNQVMGREVTKTFGFQMANKLLSEKKILDMNFPRLRMPRLLAFGCSYKDYHDIARLIIEKKIDVYETEGEAEDVGFRGVYCYNDHFVFSKNVVNNPDFHFGTIVHEVTHAIQDMKKWKESQRDREIDPHFAQALIMVLREGVSAAKTERLGKFLELAKNAKNNTNYFRKSGFVRKVPNLQHSIHQEYRARQRDKQKFVLEFIKRERTNGIGV